MNLRWHAPAVNLTGKTTECRLGATIAVVLAYVPPGKRPSRVAVTENLTCRSFLQPLQGGDSRRPTRRRTSPDTGSSPCRNDPFIRPISPPAGAGWWRPCNGSVTDERLLVRDGEPVIEAGVTQLVRRIRLKGQNGSHPAGGAADTALKSEVVELLDQLAAIGDGTVRTLTVIDGLPGDLEVEEEPDDDGDAPVVSPFLPLAPPEAGAAIPVPSRRR